MAPLSRPVKELDRTNKPCLKLRVVRRFYRASPYNNNRSLEVVFHDQEGGRITGIVKSLNLGVFDDKFTEGRVYAIRQRSYYVENNTGKFLTSLNKFRIIFHAKTVLIEMPEDHHFPDFMFDCRNFATLVDPNTVDDTILFDVIGKVTEIHNPQEREFSGRKARLIEIVLEDLSGRQLSCTLWGDYVEEILVFEGNLRAGPPVLILQLCRAKVYRDKVTITNSFEVTKIHTLETIPAIANFTSQIADDDLVPLKSLSRGSLTSHRLEFEDMTSGKLNVSSVETIYLVDEGTTFWICAVIGSITREWSYLACTKCNKKLENVGNEYVCNSCHKSFKTGVYRYKLHIEVGDQTANASLLCWDREAEKLIGRPCHELHEEYVEILKADKDKIPYDLNKLVDQTVLFKVRVGHDQLHSENSVFTVNKLVTDPILVEKYNKLTLDNENEADFFSLMMNEDKYDGMSSEEEVTTPIKKIHESRVEGDRSTVKSLTFDDDCVGSSSANMSKNCSKGEKKYVRKYIPNDVEEDSG